MNEAFGPGRADRPGLSVASYFDSSITAKGRDVLFFAVAGVATIAGAVVQPRPSPAH
jgi:hypothetical protein